MTVKVLLYILLVLQIIASCVLFLALIAHSLLLALVYLFVGALQVVLTLAVIGNMDSIDVLHYEISRLRSAVRELQAAAEKEHPEAEATYPAENPAELARNTWVCVKCATVNKAETTHCAHCGAAYAASVNPTDDATTQRKRSRWVKDEPKRRWFGKDRANS